MFLPIINIIINELQNGPVEGHKIADLLLRKGFSSTDIDLALSQLILMKQIDVDSKWRLYLTT